MQLKLARWFRHASTLILPALVLASLWPIGAGAHPLGNFTINRYSRVEVSADQVRVRYVVDMAEIPAFQERARIDLDHDDAISAAEQDHYLAQEVAVLKRNLHLTVNGEPLGLEPQTPQLEWLAGQGGLATLRLSAWFTAKLPSQTVWQAHYRDDNFAGRLGWQEVVVRAMADADLLAADVPAQDVSDELRHYPQDLLHNPASASRATFRFAPAGTQAGGTKAAPVPTAAPTPQARNTDRFTQLIASPDFSPGALALALLIALVWGAAHALSPGHGKTLVAAYLIGSRATVRHALLLGATTATTHTAGVFLLGLITLLASHYIMPEQLYPWLEVISGLLVVAVGATLARGYLRTLRRRYPHPHGHSRAEVNETVYVVAPQHSHHHLFYPQRHPQDHDHLHGHDHSHDHDHDHDHDHHHAHDHHHSAGHSHLPPGVDGEPITWRSLVALGVSGGLLPCPAALVVMLGAIALNRIGFGLLLVTVFSLGLAGTLTAIGIAMVQAQVWLKRFSGETSALGRNPVGRQILQALPAVSAVFILLTGLGITLTALVQTGMFHG